MVRRRFLGAAAGGSAAALGGCAGHDANSGTASADDRHGDGDGERLTIATATTAYDTGLLDVLHSAFESRFDARVMTHAKGTGAALETARSGDADAVVVHARGAEDALIRDGAASAEQSVPIAARPPVASSRSPTAPRRPR